MFIIDLHYLVPIAAIEKHITAHRSFLDKYYEKKLFISSGPKHPRTGGVILATAESLELVENIIKEDPFYIHQLASYTITCWNPNKGEMINR